MEQGVIEVDRGSDRNFGIVFTIVLALIGCYIFWKSGEIAWWSIVGASCLLIVSIFSPALLKYPNYWWFRSGMLLGAIVAPIVMALVYVTTLVPTGLLLRLAGKDILRIRFDPTAESYWIKRETPIQPMKNQF